MKIEMGESLLLSWLKHIKECQLVQLNWKPSRKWECHHREALLSMMQDSKKLFEQKYGYDLYKGSSSLEQVLGQAEIDVMGINFQGEAHIYAIDVAFHEAGVNYGSRQETVAKIVMKCLRMAMCIYGYYQLKEGTIIFAAPKINPAIIKDILATQEDIHLILRRIGLNYDIRIVANEDFGNKILDPVLQVLGDVADTSELFMRSLQMYNMFTRQSDTRGKAVNQEIRPIRKERVSVDKEPIQIQENKGLSEMKIGMIARTVLRRILQSGNIDEAEVERLQDWSYSKQTFDLQFPLLQKAGSKFDKVRYYTEPIVIRGQAYYICSQWYEVPTNNDRPYLLTWIKLHSNDK